MGWIEKVMKDISLDIRCDNDDTTVDGGSRSCAVIIQDLIVTRLKVCPPC